MKPFQLHQFFFIPSGMQAEPCANEVASLLSRVTYSFMDKIVFYAWRVPDIGINDMPHLPQRQSVETLCHRGMKVSNSYYLVTYRSHA